MMRLALWYLLQLLPVLPGSAAAGPPADETSWHQYVRAPPNSVVSPQSILQTLGDVSNPNGLLSGQGPTVLTRTANSTDVPTIVIDFGQNVVGQLTIDFAGSQNYSQGMSGVMLIFSETQQYLTNRSDFTRSDNAGGSTRIISTGTDQIAVQTTPYKWIDEWGCEFGTQVCSDGLHGFRYVKILLDALSEDQPYTTPYGQVSISSVKLQWSGYLGTPDTYTGSFECSDSNLTQWWYDASYTTEMGTDVFHDNDTEPRGAASPSILGKQVIHDGAKRDRDPYMGDLGVSGLTSYLTHDFHEAASNVLEDLVQHQRSDGWIPPASINNYTLSLFDYPLWWVVCSWDYVFYTGNTTYLQDYYPNLLVLLDEYYPSNTDNSSNLLVRPSSYGDYAFLPRPGSAAYYSALYVWALNRAADLADILSKTDDAERWRTRAAQISSSFLTTLWDPSVSAFYDRRCTDSGCTAHAQDGNSLAILAGIASSSYATSALAYLSSATAQPWGNAFYDQAAAPLGSDFPQRVYAFISYLEISARFAVDDAASALEEIRRLYGWMASHDPGITAWEGIGTDGEPYEQAYTSMAHGWSTGIVPLLTNHVLGVTPTQPGFREWIVRPLIGDLTWARGEVPTPFGGLKVQWQRDTGAGTFAVTVNAAAGTNGTVSVEVGAAGNSTASVSLDQQVVWKDNVATGGAVLDGTTYLSIPVQGGDSHTVQVSGLST